MDQDESAVVSSRNESAVVSSRKKSATGSNRYESAVGRDRDELAVGSSRNESAPGRGRGESAVGRARNESAVGSSRNESAVDSSRNELSRSKNESGSSQDRGAVGSSRGRATGAIPKHGGRSRSEDGATSANHSRERAAGVSRGESGHTATNRGRDNAAGESRSYIRNDAAGRGINRTVSQNRSRDQDGGVHGWDRRDETPGRNRFGRLHDDDRNLGAAGGDWYDEEDRKSISGYVFQVFGNMVSWATKRQPTVSLSSTEAELVALCTAAKEGMWLSHLLTELEVDNLPIVIHEDNIPCINFSKEPREHQRMKHIDVKFVFIRDLIKKGDMKIIYKQTNDQPADALTKPLSKVQHHKLFGLLNMKIEGTC